MMLRKIEPRCHPTMVADDNIIIILGVNISIASRLLILHISTVSLRFVNSHSVLEGVQVQPKKFPTVRREVR